MISDRDRLIQSRKDAMKNACNRLALTPAEAMKWLSWLMTPRDPGNIPMTLRMYDQNTASTIIAPCYVGSGFSGSLYFIEGDMISFAQKVSKSERVVLLNMANAFIPGGGFMSGARAQEEQLCHRSSLFLSLKVAKKEGIYPILCGLSLLTRNVTLFLDSEFRSTDPTKMCVVSVAAKHYKSREDAFADGELKTYLKKAWKAVIGGAALSHASVLVVSALGCGAFNNPPAVVGECLAEILREKINFGEVRKICVVVMEDHNSNGENVSTLWRALDDASVADGKFKPIQTN